MDTTALIWGSVIIGFAGYGLYTVVVKIIWAIRMTLKH